MTPDTNPDIEGKKYISDIIRFSTGGNAERTLCKKPMVKILIKVQFEKETCTNF